LWLQQSLSAWEHSFETRPGPAGHPGARTGPGWRKNEGRKNPVWPDWPGRLTQWPGCKPVDFYYFFIFFTKTMSFWFFLKTNWPGQNPEPGPWAGPGLKTMLESIRLFFEIFFI
jgi:hypothetical protein